MRYCMALLLVAFAATGCSNSTEPPVATTLAANSSVTVAAAVGVPVSPSPSVIVKDQKGSPMTGIAVTFTVASGGGSVTGGAATTGADGIATVGSWVLGTSTGQNVLTVSSGTLTPVTFNATASAGAPTAVTKTAGDNVSAVVGSAVASAPTVVVKDAFGNPVPNVNVVFAVGAGGGSITNGTRTTGTDGTATVGSWTLGTIAAANTVTATAGSLAPVTFSASALAGPAARVLAISGNSQTARAGTRAPQIVAARVTDSFNNGKSGVTVVFAVTQGGGSIVGPSTVTTDFQGIAQISAWTLGPQSGVNLITATVTGIGSATFAATTTPNICAEGTHVVGGSNSGVLDASDCVLEDGASLDLYRVQVAGPSSIEFREKSTAFDAYLYLTDGAGFNFAEGDDDETSSNALMKVLMPPGIYHIGATSFDPGESGAYTVTSSVVSESEERCSIVFLIAGITTSQNVASTDCVNQSNATLHADVFAVALKAGMSVTLHMSSSAVDPYLELYNNAGTQITTNDNMNSSTTAADIRYTATADGYYLIIARTALGNQVGAYDLSVTLNSSSVRATQQQGAAARTVSPRKGRHNIPWSLQN
jgi:hypothetical protein